LTPPPSNTPTEKASSIPSSDPTEKASSIPSSDPTEKASSIPSSDPTEKASSIPSSDPTEKASSIPSSAPTSSTAPTTYGNDPLPLSWVVSVTNPPALLTDDNGRPVISIQYYASNRSYGVDVFEEDCVTKSSVPSLDYSHSESSTKGFIDIYAKLTLVQADIESSPIWESTSSFGGFVNFCVSAFLYMPEGNEIAFRSKLIFKVGINKLAEFDVENISTLASDTITPVNDAFYVEYGGTVDAYECDPATMERITPSAHGPSDLLNVCVEETSSDNLEVVVLQSLTLKAFISMEAIVDGDIPQPYEDIVLKKCEDGKCLAQIHLIQELFTSGDASELNVVGSVLLEPMSDGNLRMGNAEVSSKRGFSISIALDADKPCRDGVVGKVIASVLNKLTIP